MGDISWSKSLSHSSCSALSMTLVTLPNEEDDDVDDDDDDDDDDDWEGGGILFALILST